MRGSMKHCLSCLTFLLGIIGLSAIAAGQTANLALGSGTTTAGGSITLPLTLLSNGTHPVAFQWSFNYSADITGVTVTIGGSSTTAQKSVTCLGTLCLLSGMNANVIADGTVVTATFQIAANPTAQSIPIQITGVIAAAADGTAVSSNGTSGTVTIGAPAPVLNTLSCSATTVLAPGSTSCTVSLTSVAQTGGSAVPLASNNASLSVPSSVTVAAGQASATFTATAGTLTSDQSAVITAGTGSVTRTANLTLSSAVSLVGLTCSSGTSTSGSCTASLNKSAT